MANKTFLRAAAVYEAADKRLQNDIEITGATVTHTNGRIAAIAFGGGGGGGVVDFSTMQAFGGNVEAVAAIGVGALYKSTTLINGSPIILITV